jgi:very-short-patch-repair endonuclease
VYNPRLYVGDVFLASPDAWWEAFGVAVEFDSREYHFDEADWEHTMQRHARMTAAGISVLHFTPRRVRFEPQLVISTIRQTLQTGGPVAGLRTIAGTADR